jgi:hypothetical protein
MLVVPRTRPAVDYLYSLYDALVSINVPSDKARAVVDAMERDMGTTLATKQDLLLIRQEIENRYTLLSREIDSLRGEVAKDLQSLRGEVAKDLQSLRGEVAKDLQSLRGEVAKDLQSMRRDVAKDLEALRLSITLRLGSMLVVGFGVMLTALRLWL